MKKNLKKPLALLMALSMTSTVLPNVAVAANVKSDETLSQYLSDWDWLSAETGWNDAVKDGCTECSAIKLKNQNGEWHTYQKGIGAHAESEIVYDIEGKGVLRFQSDIGVNKAVGSCGFTVLTDVSSKPLFQTTEPLTLDKPVQHVDVEIPANATKLILKTDDGGDGKNSDHSVWADAKLILDAGVQENLYQVKMKAPSQMNVDATDQVTVSGTLVNGNDADLSSAKIEYTSSDTEVLTVSKDGELKALKNGVVTLKVTVTLNDVTKTVSKKILVGESEDLLASIASPDNSLKAEFCLNDEGVAQYVVKKDNDIVAETSNLGLVTNVDDFTSGLLYIGKSEVTQGVDDYDLTGAKVSHVHDTYNEVTYTFWGQSGTELKVVARMYNDGLAFRYVIDGEGELSISSEKTTVKIPEDSTVHALTYHPQHEGYPIELTLSQLTAKNYDSPMLYETPNGTWGMIGEAGISGSNYCVSRFGGDGKGNVQYLNENNSKPVTTQLPFESPWRIVLAGDAGTINMNTMAENLNPDFEGDFSWVKPGVTSWTWLNGDPCNDLDTYKEYVDLSVEMGWQYLLMDEGWQLGGQQGQSGQSGWYGYGEWFDELSEYAQENNIGLLAWAHNKDLKDKYEVTEDHSSKLCKMLDEWKSKGIVGIKPDFFYAGTQDTIAWMDTLIKETAHHQMLLDMHGCVQPAGERRTYPHLLAREGVFGGEQVHWNNSNLTAYNNCMLPFTRNAVGPMDYTPMFKRRFTGHGRNWDHNFSSAHMAAMPVVFETGLQCLADKPASYLGSAAELYFDGMPADWEDSKVLEADPGKYVTIARKAKTGDWYVGAMCDAQRNAEIDMSFLEKGHTYYAVICKDETLDVVTNEYMKVTSETKLSIPMLKTGGAAIRIMYNEPEVADTLTLDASELKLKAYSEGKLTAVTTKGGQPIDAQVMWSSDNESVATVADGTVYGVNPGTANITATVKGFDGEITAVCTVEVTPILADGWKIVNGDAKKHWTDIDENTLEIEVQNGEYYYQNGKPKETTKNVFLHDVKDTDFEASVTLDFAPKANYQTAGLIIYKNGTANFSATRRFHSSFGGNVVGIHGTNVNKFTETYIKDPSNTRETIDLKIAKNGTKLISYYSLDGRQTWTEFNSSDWAAFDGAAAEDLQIGVYTANNSNTTEKATFKNFTVKYAEEETVLPFFLGEEEIVESDKTMLEALIGYANSQKENADYANVIPVVKAAFEKALADAVAVYENTAATQEEVDAAYDKLLDMVHMLDFIKGDTTNLQLLVDVVKDMNEDLFTKDSWAVVEEALAKAEAVLADENAMQEEIDAATKELQAAKDVLVRIPVDKAKLQKLVDKSKKYEDAIKDYTPATADIFKAALAHARDILANEDVTQTQIDEAYAMLQNAIFGLRLTPNKDKLEDLIKDAKAVDTAKYTADSVAAFTKALAKAEAVFSDANATEEDVKAAEKALKKAQKDLVAKADADVDADKKDNDKKVDDKVASAGGNNKPADKAAKTGDANTALPAAVIGIAALAVLMALKKRR